MIPNTIHYCWFGKTEKNELIKKCIKSWKEKCPNFEIKEWNEDNFDINSHPFTKKAYELKKWAFVSDYARLKILYENGGFYLDTDMLLLSSLSNFTKYDCVLGEEEEGIISAGMIGSKKEGEFILSCLKYYDKKCDSFNTIPRILTEIYTQEFKNDENIKILPPKTFYPFNQENIKYYKGQNLGDDVYGVHLWNYSWGHPLNKFLKKIGIYSFAKKTTEKLGIKKIIKKLLGFI